MYTQTLCILLLFFVFYVYGQSQCGNCPSLVTISAKGLRPSGIEWDPKNNFLVSSETYGTIYRVLDSGAYSPFIQDKRLQSTFGIKMVPSTNQLLIVNNNGSIVLNNSTRCTSCVVASLIVANLNTASVTSEVDLTPFVGGKNPLANGVTTDNNGNAYVTDSHLNQIYQINYNSGKVSTVITSNMFQQNYQGGTMGLNGIDYIPQANVIVVSRSDNGKLYRVNLSNSNSVSEIKVDSISGIAGLKFIPSSGNLAAVSGSGTLVAILTSDDSWVSAKIIQSAPLRYPTATNAAIRLGTVYVTHSRTDQSSNFTTYQIEEAFFSSVPQSSSTPRPTTVSLPLLNNRLVGDWRSRCITLPTNTTLGNTTLGYSSMMYTLHFGGRPWNLKVEFFKNNACGNPFGTYVAQGTFLAFNVTQPSSLPRLSGSFSFSNTPSLSVSSSNSASPGTLSPSRSISPKGQTPTPSPSAFYNGVVANDPSLYVYIPGAYPADFLITTRTLTPHTLEAAALYNQSGCGASPFYVDTATTLKQGACAIVGAANESSNACPHGERDVLFFNSTSLFLGNRDNHVMCNLPRPTSLGEEFRCISSACGNQKSGGDGMFSPDGKDIAIFVIVIVALLLCLCCLCILLIFLIIKR